MKKLALVLALATTIVSVSFTQWMGQAKAASGKISSIANFTNLSVQDMGSLRLKLAIENPLRQKTKIYLMDKDNNVLFDEYSLSSMKYIKFFDLSNLADGNYTFVVVSSKDKMKKDFSISTKTLRDVSLASNWFGLHFYT